MSMNNITKIDLLRHGELKAKGIFCASPDEPLSEQGWQDLYKTTHAKKWDVIISSDFLRCYSFAKKLAEERGVELSVSKQFQEMDFGRWMGLSTKEIWQEEKEHLSKLWSNPDNFIAPDGESLKSFNKRVAEGLYAELKQHQGESILIISHSGVIRSILSLALNISNQSALKFTIDYAQLTRLHYYSDNEFSLQSLGA